MTPSSFRRGLIASALYVLIIGVGMAVMYRVFGVTYGAAEMVRTLWFVEIVLSLFTIWAVKRMGGPASCGFGSIDWVQLVWLLPSLLLVAWMLFTLIAGLSSQPVTQAQWGMIALIGFTTALVGFSEETMFRGILLRSALTKLSLRKSMFVSAIGFSLLHSVNVFGGALPVAVTVQLALTFLIGMLLAPIALRIGSLWPLIIWHFLWNFCLITGVYAGIEFNISLGEGENLNVGAVSLVLHLILAVILWLKHQSTLRENRERIS